MIKNYLKVAVRNLKKYKLYSIINVSGLTLGMTCFILIALYMQFEVSYDKHFENADRIYRVYQQQKGNDFKGVDLFNVAPKPLAPAMRRDFPEVEASSTVQLGFALLSRSDKIFGEVGLYSDEFLFDVFNIEILAGDGQAALSDPSSILLTESLAKKLFGDTQALGQTVTFRNTQELRVGAIIADAPINQHFIYEYIAPYSLLPYYDEDADQNWGSNNYKAYVLLKPGSNPDEVEGRFEMYNETIDAAYANAPFTARYFLQSLKDIHLRSKLNFEIGATGDIRYIYLLAAIAFIILLLASINYMNLATARSASRVKEVGMRKVLGANKKQLVYQLLGESFFLSTISFMLAIGISSFLLPAFSELVDKEIPFSLVGSRWLLLSMFFSALVVGGMSGLYPAIFISAVSPTNAFKGKIFAGKLSGFSLRNVLVVGQFATGIILAIGSLVVFQQLKFIQTKKLGYNRDHVIYLPTGGDDVDGKHELIRSELLSSGEVEKVSFARVLPLNSTNQGIVDSWEGNTTGEKLWIYRNFVDYEFFDLFEIELIEGRNFSPEFGMDSTNSYILNESAVSALGWTSAVGKDFRNGKVIGVVKDFHFQPFDLKIEPLQLKFVTEQYGTFVNIAMKVNSSDIESTMANVKSTMSNLFPNQLFEPRFMDDEYDKMYRAEQQFGNAFGIFTMIALFIACMGLFGLVSHSVVQRTKEIGIRKVLGASTTNIIRLVSTDFIKLIFIAIVVASPVAYYFMQKWLQNFTYHTRIQWWVFAISSIAAVVIAILTIGMQSFKAAVANPVDSLRAD